MVFTKDLFLFDYTKLVTFQGSVGRAAAKGTV